MNPEVTSQAYPFFLETALRAGFNNERIAADTPYGEDLVTRYNESVYAPAQYHLQLHGWSSRSTLRQILEQAREYGTPEDHVASIPLLAARTLISSPVYRQVHDAASKLHCLVHPTGINYDTIHSGDKKRLFAESTKPDPFIDFLREHGFLEDVQTAFDDGCGNGRNTIALANAGIESLGIDASPTIAKKASEQIEGASTRLRARATSICRTTESALRENGKFDLGVFFSRFHLDPRFTTFDDRLSLPDKLELVRNHLTPSGKIALTLKIPEAPYITNGLPLDTWDANGNPSNNEYTGISVVSPDGLGRWAEQLGTLKDSVSSCGFRVLYADKTEYPEGYDHAEKSTTFNRIVAQKN